MRSRIIFAFSFGLVFAASVFGQNWINPAGGSWGDTSNWSPNTLPGNAVFNLGSTLGYTVTIPSGGETPQSVAVQTDNTTINLNGSHIFTPVLNVATSTGQTGSLTLVGPGYIELYNYQTQGSGNLDVGDQGGTGQLTVNGASIENEGNSIGHFDANGFVVENGGKSICPHL